MIAYAFTEHIYSALEGQEVVGNLCVIRQQSFRGGRRTWAGGRGCRWTARPPAAGLYGRSAGRSSSGLWQLEKPTEITIKTTC